MRRHDHDGRATVALVTVSLTVLAACGAPGATDRPTGPRAPTSDPGTPITDDTDDTDDTDTEQSMRIRITIGEQRFSATLEDSAATDDLLAQLPVTFDMAEHGGVEKTGPLPAPLSVEGQPEAADPDVGDVGYYAPGQDLVLYHGDQSSFPGIVVLGRLEGDAAARIAELPGTVTATVEAG